MSNFLQGADNECDEMPGQDLLDTIAGTFRDIAARRSPAVLLPVLTPVLVTLVVVAVGAALPIYATLFIAFIMAVPAAVVTWFAGVRASESLAHESNTSAEITHIHIQQLRHISLLESGSSLYAGWYLTLRLREEVERAKRYGQLLSVLLLAPSEAAGPPVRRGLENQLRHRLRSSDVAGVLPDDRVAVILPNTGIKEARQAARRLQPHASSCGYQVGAARLSAEVGDHEELLSAAVDDIQVRRKRTKRRAA